LPYADIEKQRQYQRDWDDKHRPERKNQRLAELTRRRNERRRQEQLQRDLATLDEDTAYKMSAGYQKKKLGLN
jgi:hypothetical protein